MQSAVNEVVKMKISEEVVKPRVSKKDDNWVDMKLKKSEEDIEKMKEMEK